MLSRAGVLERLQEEPHWWEGILADIGDDRMEEAGIMGGWTFKVMVAHLSGWQRRTLNRLQAGVSGEPEAPTPWPEELNDPGNPDHEGQVDHVNHWLYEHSKDRPVEMVLAESRNQWDELQSLLERMPEDLLLDAETFPFLDGQSLADAVVTGSLFGHFHDEHEPEIQSWFAENGRARMAAGAE